MCPKNSKKGREIPYFVELFRSQIFEYYLRLIVYFGSFGRHAKTATRRTETATPNKRILASAIGQFVKRHLLSMRCLSVGWCVEHVFARGRQVGEHGRFRWNLRWLWWLRMQYRIGKPEIELVAAVSGRY